MKKILINILNVMYNGKCMWKNVQSDKLHVTIILCNTCWDIIN